MRLVASRSAAIGKRAGGWWMCAAHVRGLRTRVCAICLHRSTSQAVICGVDMRTQPVFMCRSAAQPINQECACTQSNVN